MAYTLKDVFYLDTSVKIASGTAGAGSAQLDLSAYIDPIAKGRTRATGLAVYRIHWAFGTFTGAKPIDDAEAGTAAFGLIAGYGAGNNDTGALTTVANSDFKLTNNLLMSSGDYYGPKSMVANASTPQTDFRTWVDPSDEVPYVVVRDNVCVVYMVGDNFTANTTLSCRLECAQVTLDQATLNQLLRTQTV